MLFIHDTAQWLDDVDPWSDQEALDLLDAVKNCRTQGLFHCSISADGAAYFVMAAHASGPLLLPTREAWQGFARELAERYEGAAAVLAVSVHTGHGLPSQLANVRRLFASAA